MSQALTPPPEDDLDALRAFWLEAGKTLVKDSLKTLDETARQVIAVAGVLEGLYFHAIVYTDLRGQIPTTGQFIIYILPIVLLLISLVAALGVFFPERSEMELRSWEAARLIYKRTLREKLVMVRIASISLILGVLALLGAMLLYLQGSL